MQQYLKYWGKLPNCTRAHKSHVLSENSEPTSVVARRDFGTIYDHQKHTEKKLHPKLWDMAYMSRKKQKQKQETTDRNVIKE